MGHLKPPNPKWLIRCGWCGYEWVSQCDKSRAWQIIDTKCPACMLEGLDMVEKQ